MELSSGFLNYLDVFLFGALPYLSLTIFLIVTIQRYRQDTFTYSTLSSQFLENRQHFWAMVPFHYGLLTVLAGHIVAFAIPRAILAWNGVPIRLYVLEVSALICGLLTAVGLVMALIRRSKDTRVRGVTTASDWVLFAMLLFQVSTGVLIAVFVGWGSSWFAAAVSPYLWSLVKFQPDWAFIVGLPLLAKLHIVSAFLMIAFFPFTRLVHVLVIPNQYLWRRAQMVRWYGFRGSR
ncbi:MAG: respiratory nitrate reductase subunit gamma [Gemmatimonadetes bacterium]|nr:respiratory nitrate reductase subunit gamma [Gemmatimonadota bacterium]